jgi:hypothetical protein
MPLWMSSSRWPAVLRCLSNEVVELACDVAFQAADYFVIQIMTNEDRIAQDPRLAWQREQLPHILAEHRLHTASLRAFYRDSDVFRVLQQSAPLERLAADLQVMASNL